MTTGRRKQTLVRAAMRMVALLDDATLARITLDGRTLTREHLVIAAYDDPHRVILAVRDGRAVHVVREAAR